MEKFILRSKKSSILLKSLSVLVVYQVPYEELKKSSKFKFSVNANTGKYWLVEYDSIRMIFKLFTSNIKKRGHWIV